MSIYNAYPIGIIPILYHDASLHIVALGNGIYKKHFLYVKFECEGFDATVKVDKWDTILLLSIVKTIINDDGHLTEKCKNIVLKELDEDLLDNVKRALYDFHPDRRTVYDVFPVYRQILDQKNRSMGRALTQKTKEALKDPKKDDYEF